ncbi:hypothetical protein [Candidatus Ichthyocystis sparus]|uniref:hypothetical protein n=1 Tax=Candidatus Ichthyocystis sparus TaxID=1561004 RepID=UPI000B82A9E5|nr:hypothetical protein [Candidatus Ichthyocystis sparus]
MLYKTGFLASCSAEYCARFCPGFIGSLFSVSACNASGYSLLPLTGESLRSFWIFLSSYILGTVDGIF